MPRQSYNLLLSKKIIFIFLLTLFLNVSEAQQGKSYHTNTIWSLLPSIKYDAFCLVNTLMGDSFYTSYYPRVYKHYDSLFTEKVRNSLADLKKYKDKNGMILSAYLCNVFYRLQDSSFSEMVESIKDRSLIKSLISKADYAVYNDIRKDLVNVFEFLIENDFEKNYILTILPQIKTKIRSLQPLVNKYNIVNNIEKTVGLPLQTDTIKFYLVKYAKPHGISINHTIFLSDVSYDINTSLKVAIHEMMHPYFIPNNDDVSTAINSLKTDSFIYNAFREHDKSFGYNGFEDYINEASVRALEQVISSQLNLSDNSNQHWKTEDKGMHVFGAILIYEMKRYNFPGKFEGTFTQLLLKTIEDVKVSGGKTLYDDLYN
jgi:hypothetical protein